MRVFRHRRKLFIVRLRQSKQRLRTLTRASNGAFIQEVQNVRNEHPYTLSRSQKRFCRFQRQTCIPLQNSIAKRAHAVKVRAAKHRRHVLIGQLSFAVRNAGIRNRKHITNAPCTCARDCRNRFPVVLFPDAIKNLFQLLFQIRLRNELEVKPHTARKNGRRNLMRFGRCQNKHRVRGRLFERLQKGVESLHGKHVNFVHNVHLVLPRHGRILHLFAKVAHLVHAVVGSGVNLVDIQVFRTSERLTRRALSARRAVYGAFTVDCLRENFRNTRLTRSARAAKQICVPDTSAFDLVFQYRDDMFLPNDVRKALRSEGAV